MTHTKETADLYLSAYLLTKGLKPVVRTERETVIFGFPATPEAQNAVDDFQSNASIPILDFLNSYEKVRRFALDHRHGRVAVWRG